MIHSRTFAVTAVGLVFTTLLIFISFLRFSADPASGASSLRWWQTHEAVDIFQPIHNETLGFEKIFVLNLPQRSDKRDILSLAASLTGIKLDYLESVRGEDVINKSLPVGQEERTMSASNIGSWRSHMNAIRTVVEQAFSSVLILEDDVDWDIRLKSQLVDFAKGTRYLLSTPSAAVSHSPYGDCWDVLWLGLCHDMLAKDDARVYVILNDPSVPNLTNLRSDNKEEMKQFPNHSRLIHMAGEPLCSFAYAISAKGAQKLLYGTAIKELRGIFDNALSWWCTDHSQNATCLVAQPPYFFHHRPAGKSNKASDIQDYGTTVNVKGHSQNIRWSTKLNLEKLRLGQTNYEDSYPDNQIMDE